MDIAFPQGENPVIDLDCRGHRDDQRRGRKEEAEVRIHATDVHVVRPNDEAQTTDRDDRPNHHSVAENVFSRVRAEQVRNETESRQSNDINLGVTEEPQQMLEQNRAAAFSVERLAHRQQRRHKEARIERAIEQHHDRCH